MGIFMTRFTLAQFTNFLKTVDLQSYREQFQFIKTVEMDLPKQIQALRTIYEQYWQNKCALAEPVLFDDYYKVYWDEHENDIIKFWHTTGFGTNCDCFKKGLKARIYRTWVALITQIHGGYVAESVFGKNSVKMGTELDHKNVDILVVNSDGTVNLKIQIKKETHRPEIARMHKNVTSTGGIVDVYYIVPNYNEYENEPYYKIGKRKNELRDSLKEFIKFNTKGTLDRLPNGFVIFTPNAFKELL